MYGRRSRARVGDGLKSPCPGTEAVLVGQVPGWGTQMDWRHQGPIFDVAMPLNEGWGALGLLSGGAGVLRLHGASELAILIRMG